MALPSSTYDTATLVNPGSSLTDFTLVVDLSRMSAAWWAAVDTSDGTKGRAAKDSGPTELACDWIDFDDVAETGLLRVKWSGTLSDTGTQTLRIYPPQAANASVAASATYGSDNAYDSNWSGYWPFDGNANDRTGYQNNLTANNSPTYVSYQVGQGVELDNTSPADYFSLSSPPSELKPNGDFTISLWMESVALANNETMIARAPVLGARNYQYSFLASKQSFFIRDDLGNSTDARALATRSVNTKYHLAVVRDTGASLIRFYGDGSTDGTTSDNTTGDVNVTAADFYIGVRYGANSFAFGGTMDDVQFHKAARSAAWISYEFDQTNDQATLWGTWTNVPVAGTTTSSGALALSPVVMHYRRMMGVS